MLISGYQNAAGVDVFNSEQYQSSVLGALVHSNDGRKFRYVKNGSSSALVAGNLIQTAAEDTQFQEMAVQASVVAGAVKIPVTLGSSATTANMFAKGILVVSTTPGLGQMFTIATHDVTLAAGTCNFYVEEPVRVALTTSSKVSVMKNPYDSVIQHPTTSTGTSVGGALIALAASYYGWVQSGGLGVVLGDSTATTAALQSLTPSVTTAGAVTKQVSLAEVVGSSYTAVTVSAKVLPLRWQID